LPDFNTRNLEFRNFGTTRRFRDKPKPASIYNVEPVSGEWWKIEKVD